VNSEDILARLKENEAALCARRGGCRPVRLIGGSPIIAIGNESWRFKNRA
jgi:hypothetical protein